MDAEGKERLEMAARERMLEEEGERSLISDDGEVLSYYDEGADREMEIRLEPRSAASFMDAIRMFPNAAVMSPVSREEIAEFLAFMDPAMTCSLDTVYVWSREDGEEALADAAGVPLDNVPQTIGEGSACLGCFWRDESSVIIDVSAIRDDVAEMCEGDLFLNGRHETRIGIFTTLSHEIGHLGFENPLFPECAKAMGGGFGESGLEDMEWLRSEEGVEDWGRRAWEDWNAALAEKAKLGRKIRQKP